MKTRLLLALALGQFLSVNLGSAAIVNGIVPGGSALAGGGTFVILTPPLTNAFGPANSVGSDNFESLNLFGFDETQDFVLTSNLVTDLGTSPIPSGTAISSHYVFFDPATNESTAGIVVFDTNVLAVIASTNKLADSDYLGNPGVNYLSPTARGLEPGDSVIISGPKQIMVQLSAGSPGDYIRVITKSLKMPDPAVNIVTNETNVVVSWPTNATGFTLQFATNLAWPIHWTNHPVTPVVLNHEFKITNVLSGEGTFFRLIRP